MCSSLMFGLVQNLVLVQNRAPSSPAFGSRFRGLRHPCRARTNDRHSLLGWWLEARIPSRHGARSCCLHCYSPPAVISVLAFRLVLIPRTAAVFLRILHPHVGLPSLPKRTSMLIEFNVSSQKSLSSKIEARAVAGILSSATFPRHKRLHLNPRALWWKELKLWDLRVRFSTCSYGNICHWSIVSWTASLW